jgi:Fe-Mn family superoxide dismutase
MARHSKPEVAMFGRRTLLKSSMGAAALALGSSLIRTASAQAPAPAPATPAGPFHLPKLGYAYTALEPHIDAQTMEIHYTRHHQAYVNAINGVAERWPEIAKIPVETTLQDLSKVPEKERTAVRNNLGGHWNHSFFWELMTPGGPKEPQDKLRSGIDGAFGDVTKMKQAVNAAAASRFGSGWAWLIVDKDAKLAVVSTPNQDTPLEMGARAVVLGVDVWEHAYYLKYQNRRPDYLGAWWNVVNWDKAMENFNKAKG